MPLLIAGHANYWRTPTEVDEEACVDVEDAPVADVVVSISLAVEVTLSEVRCVRPAEQEAA